MQKSGKTGTDQTVQTKSGLLKPKISAESEPESASNENKASAAGADRSRNDDKKEVIEESKASQAHKTPQTDRDARAQARTSNLTEKVAASPLPIKQASDESSPSKREIQQHSGDRTSAPSKPTSASASGSTASRSGKSDDSDGSKVGSGDKGADEPLFQKHDHAKHVELIRAKAIDKVNKEKEVTLARLCRDSTTEEWTLTLYQKRQQHYSFASYVWDEIDGKWERSLVSDKRPLSGLRQHLDFSSSGKDCRVLKGSLPE